MSYLNRTEDPRRRNAAIAAVVVIHAVVGYGLVTGLTFTKLIERINNPDGIIVEDVPLPQPVPTETPTPPEDVITYIPPAPRPPLDLTEDTSVLEALGTETEETFLYPESGETVLPPAPPPAPPEFTPKRPAARNGNWITNDDYPRRALVDEAEGSVAYRLVIGTNGRVASCELTRPTGNRALDDATCRLITSRARFDAATDNTGAKVLGTYTGTVTWEIPD